MAVGPVQSQICLPEPAIDRFKATVLGAGGFLSASFVENEIFSSRKDAKHSGTGKKKCHCLMDGCRGRDVGGGGVSVNLNQAAGI